MCPGVCVCVRACVPVRTYVRVCGASEAKNTRPSTLAAQEFSAEKSKLFVCAPAIEN